MSIFICGITGHQGSSIANHLLTGPSPPKIYGITRTPDSPAAQHLSSLGVHLTHGSYTDPSTLSSVLATSNCRGLFLNLSPSFTDASAELDTAKLIIQLARAHGVQQIIYSSGLSADNPQALPKWDAESPIANVLLSKQAIENEVRTAGFRAYTILRPGSFMSNYLLPLARMYGGLVDKGRWRTAMQKDTVIPLVDVDTIGRFGAAAFRDAERFGGKEIELADEFLTVDKVLAKLNRATGRDLQAVYMTDEEVEREKGANPFVSSLFIMRDLADFVDLDAVDKWGITRNSMDSFIQREMSRVLETYKQGNDE